MPGKHGITKNKEGIPKNYNGAPKLSEKQAKHIDTNKDGKISGADFPINKGIGNYKGSGNFAMKNKVLAKSARYGEPMQKNFLGKVGKAMMGPAGMLLTKKPGSTQERDENKKSTDTVVNPDTNVVTDVATQRLIKAGAPKEVIEKAKAKFIARVTSKNKK